MPPLDDFAWQTTNYVHPECALQVSAYAKALEETINTKVDEVGHNRV